MRKAVVLLALAAFCIAAGFWWDAGHGQVWAACWTGTDSTRCPVQYGFWSGFGSVIPWALFSMGGILTGLVLAFRHTNCHAKGCWKIGKYQLAGGEYKVCGKHNPGFKGEHPTLEHIWARHLQHKGKEPGNGNK